MYDSLGRLLTKYKKIFLILIFFFLYIFSVTLSLWALMLTMSFCDLVEIVVVTKQKKNVFHKATKKLSDLIP